ncbi:MAG: diguanylate cyclase domain-containing protein [Actinomycetota bacterium]
MRILFLGDEDRVRDLLGPGSGAEVETASGLAAALRRLDDEAFDAVVADLTARDVVDPVGTIAGAAPRAAVVVVTDERTADDGLRAVRAGAQDDFRLGEPAGGAFLRRLRYAIERKKREQLIARHALYDPLTDLANRALFRERLAQAVARADRTGKAVGVLWLDLDGFKQATQGWTHEQAEQLIRAAGVRIHRSVRQVDTVGRPAGDEFTILLEGLTDPREAELVAGKIAGALKEPLLRDPDVTLSASIGIASYPRVPGDELLAAAFAALREAKREARGGHRLHGA